MDFSIKSAEKSGYLDIIKLDLYYTPKKNQQNHHKMLQWAIRNTLKANEKTGSEKYIRRIKCQFYDKKYNNLKFKTQWMGLIAERGKRREKISEIETENSTKCLKKN